MSQNNILLVPNIRVIGIICLVFGLLLIPYTAMQFTNEVNWKPFDFLVAGFLLLTTGLAAEFVLRMVTRPIHRLILLAIILLTLFIVWAELAVGIFGTPLAGS